MKGSMLVWESFPAMLEVCVRYCNQITQRKEMGILRLLSSQLRKFLVGNWKKSWWKTFSSGNLILFINLGKCSKSRSCKISPIVPIQSFSKICMWTIPKNWKSKVKENKIWLCVHVDKTVTFTFNLSCQKPTEELRSGRSNPH